MPPNTQQVCDNCRLRKTKCDRGQPCSSCANFSIRCQYLHSIRRRGPKGGKGRRLNLIKLRLAGLSTHPPQDYIDASRYDASTSISDSPYLEDDAIINPSALETSTNTTWIAGRPRSDVNTFEDELSACHPTMSATIAAHLKTFMAHLFPIMPAVDGVELLSDATNLETLPPPRRALLLSLCAVTRIQLRLDEENPTVDDFLFSGLVSKKHITGMQFLAAAERARLQFNLPDNMSQDAILTSFFLFVSNGNLEKHDHAWFYLSQSISMAILQGYEREPTSLSSDFSPKEINMRRIIFWLLFITERTYALQRRMPVLMRGKLAKKPVVLESDSPIIMNDFLNHVRLFESLPASLYDWQAPENEVDKDSVSWGQLINNQLCSVEPGNSILESQHFDTLITQQWLRVSMWRLSYGILPNLCNESAKGLSFTLPFEAGKSIMASLACVTDMSKDCHGISIEQKLFDIGLSLVDIATFANMSTPGIQVGPQDLLCAIVKTLGCMRGRESRYLPNLLNHSQIVLGLDKYTAIKGLSQPSQSFLRSFEDLSEDSASTLADEAADLRNGDLIAAPSYQPHDSKSNSVLTEPQGEIADDGWAWPASMQYDVPLDS